jgi:uncharacterized membrane protein YphA (DoxX/SURF4 family)
VYMWQMVFVFLISHLLAGLDGKFLSIQASCIMLVYYIKKWNKCNYYYSAHEMYLNLLIIIIFFFFIYYSQLAGTIVTYEIVLVQFNSISNVGSNTSANMTDNCHH